MSTATSPPPLSPLLLAAVLVARAWTMANAGVLLWPVVRWGLVGVGTVWAWMIG